MTYMAAYLYYQDGRHLEMMRSKPYEYAVDPAVEERYMMP